MAYVKLFEQWISENSTIRRNFDYSEHLEALMSACKEGDAMFVKKILDDGNIDVNHQDDLGWTPLMWAVFSKSNEVIDILLSHPEIELDIQDSQGKTAWDWADPEIRSEYPELEPQMFSDTYDEDDVYSGLGSRYDDMDRY
jgi:ankyrin repeat protein